MKTLKDISKKDYNDYKYCLNYLKTHKTIGDEKADYNGIFHIHWRGSIDNDKIILQIKSILATQKISKIYFWIENFLTTITSPSYIKLNQFHKYVEIKVFNKEIFDQVIGDKKNKERIWMYYLNYGDRRYKTDIFRLIILSIYGGVYTDADTLLLRDVRDIKINNWSSKWGDDECAEFSILKLEKNSDVYEQMYLNNPTNPLCFAIGNLDHTNPLTIYNSPFSYKHDNLNFTSLPSPFFDILWGHQHCQEGKTGIHIGNVKMEQLGDIFKKTDNEITMDTFFKGCFAFHTHNYWDSPEYKYSYAGRLNEDLDKIIEQKYNIKPMKIFQGE